MDLRQLERRTNPITAGQRSHKEKGGPREPPLNCTNLVFALFAVLGFDKVLGHCTDEILRAGRYGHVPFQDCIEMLR